eukprot:UN1853
MTRRACRIPSGVHVDALVSIACIGVDSYCRCRRLLHELLLLASCTIAARFDRLIAIGRTGRFSLRVLSAVYLSPSCRRVLICHRPDFRVCLHACLFVCARA